MKTRTPLDRNDLRIRKNDKVIEIGSGNFPTYRANVLVEKYLDSNYHRSGDCRIYAHQKIINAEAENLPFKDKEFDYLICNQVLEHSNDPLKFIQEITRVAKRGYLEVPSMIGESLFPKVSHLWAILEIDKTLVLFDKNKIKIGYPNFGSTFLNYLPYQSLALKIFFTSCNQAHIIKYEWKDNIDIIVNPTESVYLDYVEKKWTIEMTKKIFPPTTKLHDLYRCIHSIFHLFRVKVYSKFNRAKQLTLEEYFSQKEA